MTDNNDDIERVMVDIETLGTEPGAAIISIGAVKFDLEGNLGAEFYRNVSLQSCADIGLEVDPDTLDWWLGQDEEVQDVLQGGIHIRDALRAFLLYYGDADEVWARSPSFDCLITEEALHRLEMPVPWAFWETRCCRTITDVIDSVELEREGDHHNALDDAKFQARRVTANLNNV